jgi:cation/acetate symporter
MVPAIFVSILMTGNPIPQLGFGGMLADGSGIYLLDKLNSISTELGFGQYTAGSKSTIDMFFITLALMVGTAGLPHVIVRFFTVPKVRDARISAGWALFFIAILYTTAPAVAAFARTNLITTLHNTSYQNAPEWMKTWETSGLLAWVDKNGDGIIQYHAGKAFAGKLSYSDHRGKLGQRILNNTRSQGINELYIDRDIIVLANPEIAQLPAWVIALVAAGGLAAALSTAAGLLLVISSSVSHDLLKKSLMPKITEKQELLAARLAAAVAVIIAGLFGIYPPGFVAQVVAFAFGLAAASFFPAIILGIFSKKMNREGAISGMVVGILFTIVYIIYFKFISPESNNAKHWFMGISPEGIGSIGMILNFGVAFVVQKFTPQTPEKVQDLVENIRIPRGSGSASDH